MNAQQQGEDLIGFLTDRIDEMEHIARDASRGIGGAAWAVEDGGDVVIDAESETITVGDDGDLVVGYPNVDATIDGGATLISPLVVEAGEVGWHIATHSPERVLAHVEAARMVLRLARIFVADAGARAEVVLLLLQAWAAGFNAHLDYRTEWAPSSPHGF